MREVRGRRSGSSVSPPAADSFSNFFRRDSRLAARSQARFLPGLWTVCGIVSPSNSEYPSNFRTRASFSIIAFHRAMPAAMNPQQPGSKGGWRSSECATAGRQRGDALDSDRLSVVRSDVARLSSGGTTHSTKCRYEPPTHSTESDQQPSGPHHLAQTILPKLDTQTSHKLFDQLKAQVEKYAFLSGLSIAILATGVTNEDLAETFMAGPSGVCPDDMFVKTHAIDAGPQQVGVKVVAYKFGSHGVCKDLVDNRKLLEPVTHACATEALNNLMRKMSAPQRSPTTSTPRGAAPNVPNAEQARQVPHGTHSPEVRKRAELASANMRLADLHVKREREHEAHSEFSQQQYKRERLAVQAGAPESDASADVTARQARGGSETEDETATPWALSPRNSTQSRSDANPQPSLDRAALSHAHHYPANFHAYNLLQQQQQQQQQQLGDLTSAQQHPYYPVITSSTLLLPGSPPSLHTHTCPVTTHLQTPSPNTSDIRPSTPAAHAPAPLPSAFSAPPVTTPATTLPQQPPSAPAPCPSPPAAPSKEEGPEGAQPNEGGLDPHAKELQELKAKLSTQEAALKDVMVHLNRFYNISNMGWIDNGTHAPQDPPALPNQAPTAEADQRLPSSPRRTTEVIRPNPQHFTLAEVTCPHPQRPTHAGITHPYPQHATPAAPQPTPEQPAINIKPDPEAESASALEATGAELWRLAPRFVAEQPAINIKPDPELIVQQLWRTHAFVAEQQFLQRIPVNSESNW
eukprot:gene9769-7649_t